MAVTLTESRALVERIAASVELRRAARLRTFLLYVCEQTLNHGVTVIREQEIGAAVFGRPSSYDTSIDNIVRVNATELRKRLEHYFAGEGAGEEIVLEIQRGSYTPVFRRRSQSGPVLKSLDAHGESKQPERSAPADDIQRVLEGIATAGPAPLPEARPTPGGAENTKHALIWQGVAAFLLLGCALLGWQLRVATGKLVPWQHTAALRSFWGDFFTSGTETNILLADTSFAIAEDMMQRHISLADYLDYNYKRFAEDPNLTQEQRHDLMLVLERNTGSIADFRVGQQILSLNPSDPARLALKFAREYAPEGAKGNNLVLIGSSQSNPWVGLFAGKLNFDLAYDVVHGRAFIVNRSPGPGESPVYPAANDGDGTNTGYAVIAYVPGLSEKGRALIIEGTDSQATGAAGDYVTNEESMRQLAAKFPGGKIPYFEAVLRTAQLNGTPLHGDVIALHTYGK